MKSTQKFLCYSLLLVGAAIVFSIGCGKDKLVPGATVYQAQPSINYGGLSATGGGSTSNTVVASDFISSIGSSVVTAAGFKVMAVGIALTPTGVGPGTMTITYPTGASLSSLSTWASVGATSATGSTSFTTGAISANLGTAAAFAALSGSTSITWYVQTYVTNAVGTTTSASSATVQTVH